MALRIPWDIEEAVLMLDMLLQSLDGKLTISSGMRMGSHSRCRLWKLPIPEEKQN